MTKRKDSSVTVAIITAVSAVTIAVIGGVFTLLQRQPVQTSPDNLSGSSNRPLASQVTPTASADQIVFTLKDSRPEDYYVLDEANFVLRQDGKLALMGNYAQGTYINRPLPANFRAIVQFQTQHPDDQFILGLSDGRKMRPNYHFVMVPWGAGGSFKRQFDYAVKDWDDYIQSIKNSKPIQPNFTYEVIFERKNGAVNVWVNNLPVLELAAVELPDIQQFDHLYLTGAKQQQLIIDSLVLKKLDQ